MSLPRSLVVKLGEALRVSIPTNHPHYPLHGIAGLAPVDQIGGGVTVS